MIEYTCLDCGGRIISFVFSEPAEPAICSNCDWIRRHVPISRQFEARERLGVQLVDTRLRKVVERLEALRPGFHGNDRMSLDVVVVIAKEAIRRQLPRVTLMATLTLERLLDCPAEQLGERLRETARFANEVVEEMTRRKRQADE